MEKCIHAVLNNFQILILMESMFPYLSNMKEISFKKKKSIFVKYIFLIIDTKHFYTSHETMDFGRKFRKTKTLSQKHSKPKIIN